LSPTNLHTSSTYGRLLNESPPGRTKQTSFIENSDHNRLKALSHPNLDLATGEQDKKSSESTSQYQVANGLAASLNISTVASQAGLSGTTEGSKPEENRDKLSWNEVMRIAKEQNTKMYGNNKKKPLNKQDAGKTERALFCLSLKNPIRRACIRIVEWK